MLRISGRMSEKRENSSGKDSVRRKRLLKSSSDRNNKPGDSRKRPIKVSRRRTALK